MEPRVPVQKRSREKVDRALRAADDLLEREGLAALTLHRVADEAGVSVGALYQYLPDREAIVAALSANYYARLEARMSELVEQLLADPVPDPVAEVVAAMVQMYRDQTATRALRAGLQGAGQLAMAREHKSRMVDMVHTLLRGYGMPDSAVAARAMFFAADGIMHEAFAEQESGDEALIAELETMLRAYLAGS